MRAMRGWLGGSLSNPALGEWPSSASHIGMCFTTSSARPVVAANTFKEARADFDTQ